MWCVARVTFLVLIKKNVRMKGGNCDRIELPPSVGDNSLTSVVAKRLH